MQQKNTPTPLPYGRKTNNKQRHRIRTKQNDKKQTEEGKPFWVIVFQAYKNLSDKVDLNSASELLTEHPFLNNKFKITKKVFHFKEWTSENIFFVKNLLKEGGKFLNVQKFNQKYDLRVQFFEYLGCINVIRAYVREHNLYI